MVAVDNGGAILTTGKLQSQKGARFNFWKRLVPALAFACFGRLPIQKLMELGGRYVFSGRCGGFEWELTLLGSKKLHAR